LDFITFNLKLAFQEPGCPVCYLKQRNEERYIFSLLWERVNDGPTRARLVASLGFCRVHAWRMARTEYENLGGSLGMGIIYEDLASRALAGLQAYLKEKQAVINLKPSGLRDQARRWLRGKGTEACLSLPGGLAPLQPCPVCESGKEAEDTYTKWLVYNCKDSQFREWYRSSDGLCLPHLRQALHVCERDRRISIFLTETAREKLQDVHHSLSEYVRKFNWQYRDEPKTAEEAVSLERILEFFTGKK